MPERRERTTEDLVRDTEGLSCPVRRAARYVDAFLGELMCGKCFPCAFGTYEAALILGDIVAGRGTDDDLRSLRRIADSMRIASRCKRGRDTAEFLADMLDRDAFSAHIRGRCPDRECASYIEYVIVPESCVMCGECEKVCSSHAIIGEVSVPYASGFLPFHIASKRCTRCGACVSVCPTGAIILVNKRENMVLTHE